MSDNIGKILKVLAIILFIIITIGCFIVAIFIWSGNHGSAQERANAIGFAVLGGGTFVQLIISFLMYGFGRLIENSEIISSQLLEINRNLNKIKDELPDDPVSAPASNKTDDFDNDSLPTL